jgi:hypothetical protein
MTSPDLKRVKRNATSERNLASGVRVSTTTSPPSISLNSAMDSPTSTDVASANALIRDPNSMHAIAKQNGISEHRISNGTPSNGIASNGISSNGRHPTPSALSPTKDAAPSSSEAERIGREDVDRILGDLSEKLADTAPHLTTTGASFSPTHLPPEGKLEVPTLMLFGTGPQAVRGTIYDSSLQRLSPSVLRNLVAKGHMNGTICIMDNYKQCDSMLRFQGFLETGEYKPFGPIEKIECLDTENNIKVWQPGKEPRLDAIRLAEPTLQLFLHEVDLYLFAAEIEYDGLRRKSVAHIIHDYPKNLKAILALLKHIYPVATRLNDAKLVTHIEQLVSANSKSLAKVPQYADIMNLYISAKNRLGKVMLDGYITAANESNRKLAELNKRDAALTTKPHSPDVPRRLEPFSPPHSPSVRSGAGHLPGLRPDYLPLLAEAVKSNCLVVAKEAGYGTLIKKGAPIGSRNRDFTFAPGELLIVSTDEFVSNSYNNCMVYNSLGQKGDILRTLVRTVPLNLGVDGKCESSGLNSRLV